MAKPKAKEPARPVRIVHVEDFMREGPTNDTGEAAPEADAGPIVSQTPVEAESESEVTPTGIYALIRYDVTKADIRKKGKEYAALTFDTPANYEQGRRAIAVLRETRVAIEAKRKDLKAESLEYGRRVDSVASELTDLILEFEEPLKAKKKAVDDEKARIKAEKEAEEKRLLEEQVRAEREAEEARLKAEREAEEARVRAEREAEQAKLAAERAALEAERAELQRLRDEAEAARREAEEAARVERDRIAAEQERVEAARRAEQDRIAAEQRAAQAKLDEERRAFEAERERMRLEEEQRQARIRAEEDAKAQAERDRIAAEEARVAEAERQAALARRLEALRPDREKLCAYAQALHAVPVPGVTSDEACAAIDRALMKLQGLARDLEQFGAEA